MVLAGLEKLSILKTRRRSQSKYLKENVSNKEKNSKEKSESM